MISLNKFNSFSGSIPENFDKYLRPLRFEPYAIDMATRVTELAPMKVLELACGTGILTNQLLKMLPMETCIDATDINPEMLAIAKAKVSINRVKWQVVDAMSLPFENDTFDCIAVQFGVMFYPDRVKGYGESLRVLKAGGTFIFNTWDKMEHNPMILIVKELIDDYFPDGLTCYYATPFSYFDRAVIASDLCSSGFSDVDTTLLKLNGYSKTSLSAAKGLLEGTPIYDSIIAQDAGLLPELVAELSGRLARRFGAKDLKVPLQAIVASARKAKLN